MCHEKNGCAMNFIKKRFQTSYNINGIKVTSVFFNSKTDFLIKIFIDRVNRGYFETAKTFKTFNKIVVNDHWSSGTGHHGLVITVSLDRYESLFCEVFLTC